MTPYRISKRMQDAAEFRKSCLINIDMRGALPTAYDRSALILHAIYPQLPLRHVTGEDGMTRPMVTDIPQKIILEVCRRYRLVEATVVVICGEQTVDGRRLIPNVYQRPNATFTLST